MEESLNAIRATITNNPFDTSSDVKVALAFRAGYTTKVFTLDEDRAYRVNLATFDTLAKHLASLPDFADMRFSVQPSVFFCVFDAPAEEIPAKIARLFALMRHPLTHEQFDAAKQAAKDRFAECFADGNFRARLDALEYLHMTKGFTVDQLTTDYQTLDLDLFTKDVHTTIVNGEIAACCLCPGAEGTSGTDALDAQALGDALKLIRGKSDHHIASTYASVDLFNVPKPDMSKENIARVETGSRALAFTFGGAVDAATRHAIMDITAEQMRLGEFELAFDHYTTGLLTIGVPVRSLISQLPPAPAKGFDAAKRKVEERALATMRNCPQAYAMYASELLLAGIEAPEYLNALSQLTAEGYEQLFESAQVVASEGQSHLVTPQAANHVEEA